MRKLIRLLALSSWVALWCALPRASSAQTYYDIEGTVYAPGGQAAERVVVVLEDLTRSPVSQLITDADGRFRFSRVAAGTYFVVAKPNNKEFKTTMQRIELINSKHALELFPDYFVAAQQLGLVYVETASYREAIPPLVKAVEVNPKAPLAYLGLGIAALYLDRSDMAVDALERARGLDANSFRVHYFLGIALSNLRRFDEAEKALKTAVSLGGADRSGDTRLRLASIYNARGNQQQAIEEMEAYLRENPKAKNAESVRQALQK
ncbi:MAG: tetratricopeptide repeat protein, partial [Acidobacteria bacterium]|nr:tetratricopeptide repeat protein [Acidobacteriota bacterium]